MRADNPSISDRSQAEANGLSEDRLREIVEATVREASPERIILCGSRARGDAARDSDGNLLVVVGGPPFGPSRSRRSEIKRIPRALWSFRVPIDILVFGADELIEWRHSKNHIIGRSLREGRTLYERP